jgi:hypothetical protein
VRLNLEPDRQERIETLLDWCVMAAALATIPLMLAYYREWNGAWIVAGDWIIWSVFASEFAFFMSVSRHRLQTVKQRWLAVIIVILSFPLAPHVLGWSRLARLVRGTRVLRPARLTRFFNLGRMYLMRSAGGKRIFTRFRHIPAQSRLLRRYVRRSERGR